MRHKLIHTHIQLWKFISGISPSVAAIRCIYSVVVVHLYWYMYVYQSVCTRFLCAHAITSNKSGKIVQTLRNELMFGWRAHLSICLEFWILPMEIRLHFATTTKNHFDSSNPTLWLAYLNRHLSLMFWSDSSFCTSIFTENTLFCLPINLCVFNSDFVRIFGSEVRPSCPKQCLLSQSLHSDELIYDKV